MKLNRRKLRDRAEHALSRALEAGISRLPASLGRGVGLVLGEMIRFPLRVRRSTVESNLRRAFPDAAPDWIRRMVRQTYRHLGREVIQMVRLSHMTREQVMATTEIDPVAWSQFQEVLEEGRGVLLITGHYGNWEVAAAALAARGVRVHAIVKRQRNRLVDAQVEAARARLGIGTIEMRKASTQVMRALSRGGAVGIVGDQDARQAGVFVPFFGIPSSTYRGPAMFALRLRVPIFSAVARRLPDGRYRLDGQRIPVERTGDMEADVFRVTAALAAHLEREIRKDPGQYFWFHRRWKTTRRAEPAPSSEGTTNDADAALQTARRTDVE